MIKFEIRKQSQIEAYRDEAEWSQQDMLNHFNDLTFTDLELIKSFDNVDEAKAEFENEKNYCDSHYSKGAIGDLVIFDYLTLQETEYNESGDFEQADFLDEYIAPIENN